MTEGDFVDEVRARTYRLTMTASIGFARNIRMLRGDLLSASAWDSLWATSWERLLRKVDAYLEERPHLKSSRR